MHMPTVVSRRIGMPAAAMIWAGKIETRPRLTNSIVPFCLSATVGVSTVRVGK